MLVLQCREDKGLLLTLPDGSEILVHFRDLTRHKVKVVLHLPDDVRVLRIDAPSRQEKPA